MTVVDVVTCALARELRCDDVVGVGLGTPLALCACLVARRTTAPGLVVLSGGAVSPVATLAQILHHDLAGRTAGYVPHLDTMDMAERQAITMQFFRPGQVGPDGSANTSRVRTETRLIRFPGALALPDTPRLMPRIVLYHTAHEPRNLPPEVAFRTAAGGGLERGGYSAQGATRLVTNRCVISFQPAGPRLVSVHPGESVESVVAATGFALDVEDAVETPAPSEAELDALAVVDSGALRAGEFKQPRPAHEGRARA